jgi:hypothetical protein
MRPLRLKPRTRIWILFLTIKPVTVECPHLKVRNKTAEVTSMLRSQGEWRQRILMKDDFYAATFWSPNAKGNAVVPHFSAKIETPRRIQVGRHWSFSHSVCAPWTYDKA